MSLSRHMRTCLERREVTAAAEAATVQGVDVTPVTPDTAPALASYSTPEGTPDAYTDLLNLKQTLTNVLNVSILAKDHEMTVSATRELRATTETMLKVWETQKRIEAQYAQATPLSAAWIYGWLKKHHPDVLKELVIALREAHQG